MKLLEGLKKIVEIELVVRLPECDPYGFANNANYFVWFEMGRFAYARESGYKITSMSDLDIVVYYTLNTKCKFIKSAHFEDTLIVRSRIKKPPVFFAKYCFDQEIILKKTGEVLAKCYTEIVAVNQVENKVLRVEEDSSFIDLNNNNNNII